MLDERLFRRIEAKLDALLAKSGIDATKITGQLPPPKVEPLTPAQQDALNNAPATPAADHSATGGSATQQFPAPDPVTNAPSTPAQAPAPEPEPVKVTTTAK